MEKPADQGVKNALTVLERDMFPEGRLNVRMHEGGLVQVFADRMLNGGTEADIAKALTLLEAKGTIPAEDISSAWGYFETARQRVADFRRETGK